jgi:hypothetical protein
MNPTMRKFGISASVASLLLCALVGWYCIAADYSYAMLAGTYTFSGDGVRSKLLLKPDQTFHQEVWTSTTHESTSGTWRRVGEGGVSFSIEFLRIPGAKTFLEEFGPVGDGTEEDREFFGTFEKIGGVYPRLLINANPPQVIFHRKLFSF